MRRSSTQIRKTHAQRVLAVLASRGGTPIAGTFNFQKGRAPVRPLLGLQRGVRVAALRVLLLPPDRARDRRRYDALRGGCAGHTQAAARLDAGADPQRAPDRASRAAPRRSPRIWCTNARRCVRRWRRSPCTVPSSATVRTSTSVRKSVRTREPTIPRFCCYRERHAPLPPSRQSREGPTLTRESLSNRQPLRDSTRRVAWRV